jgi:hypothetical protein
MSELFAMLAWNAVPVDGTNIIKPFAAKACTFQFHINKEMTAPTPQKSLA